MPFFGIMVRELKTTGECHLRWPAGACAAAFVHKAVYILTGADVDKHRLVRELGIKLRDSEDARVWGVPEAADEQDIGVDADALCRLLPSVLRQIDTRLTLEWRAFREIPLAMFRDELEIAHAAGNVVGCTHDHGIVAGKVQQHRHIARCLPQGEAILMLDDSEEYAGCTTYQVPTETWERAVLAVDGALIEIGCRR